MKITPKVFLAILSSLLILLCTVVSLMMSNSDETYSDYTKNQQRGQRDSTRVSTTIEKTRQETDDGGGGGGGTGPAPDTPGLEPGVDPDPDPVPNEAPQGPKVEGEHILHIPSYFNQAPGTAVGDTHIAGTTKTINSSGCCVCCYAMAASYYLGREITVGEFQAVVTTPAYFDGFLPYGNLVLQAWGTSAQHSMMTLNYNDIAQLKQAVVEAIDNRRAPVIALMGERPWPNRHTSSSGHFILIHGYSEEGIYVLDPGKRANNGVIPWAEWTGFDSSRSDNFRMIVAK